MSALHQFLGRLRALFRKEKLDRDMAEEMRFHLNRRAADNVDDGMPPDEARYAAQRKFGNVGVIKDRIRDQRGWTWFENFGKDVGHGSRTLVQRPGFAFAAVLTLGLGIGANSAIFSVLNAVLLRPLPFAEPERLVTLWAAQPAKDVWQGRTSTGDFVDWRMQSTAFEEMALTNQGSPITVIADGIPERASCQYATPELYPLLGIAPVVGRFPSASELRDGAKSVVISESYWRRRFSADPGTAGRTVTFNGEIHTIVGVTPRGCVLFNNNEPDIWRPLVPEANPARRDNARWLVAIARLKTGATRTGAQAEIEAIAGRLAIEHPSSNHGWTARVMPLQEALFGNMKPWLYPLFGAVICVLLIACTNLANLLLARASVRRKEMAVRTALGAGRGRLFRQLLAEGLVLAVPGALVGLLLATASLRVIVAVLPAGFPRANEISIDRSVFVFTLLISVLAALGAALAPAWTGSATDAVSALRSAGHGTGTVKQRRTRSILVIGQIALALVLVTSASLMLNSFVRLQRVDPGFEPENLLTMEVSLGGKKYWENDPAGGTRIFPSTTIFFQQALAAISTLPPVQSVGMISWLPTGPQRGRQLRSFTLTGEPPPGPSERREAGYNAVSAGYFETMGISVRQGRGVSFTDTENAPWVVVVNAAFARKYWPGTNPIGKTLTLDSAPGQRPREVVGVVEDVRQVALAVEPIPEIYVSYPQQLSLDPGDAYQSRIHMSLVVRARGASAPVVSAIRARLAEIDPNQPVYGVQTVEQVMAGSIAPWRLYSSLLGSFAGLAAVLATLGIHAVIASAVAERRGEIGIRMALGAQRGDVLALVFRQGFGLILVGTAIGLVLTHVAARSLQGWLFGITPHDPATYLFVCVGLALIALVAIYRPAWRATKVDPLVALRSE